MELLQEIRDLLRQQQGLDAAAGTIGDEVVVEPPERIGNGQQN